MSIIITPNPRNEVYKPYNGVLVSNCGNIKNEDGEFVSRRKINGCRYLFSGGFAIYHAVAKLFLSKTYKRYVIHVDGNYNNNCSTNLKWAEFRDLTPDEAREQVFALDWQGEKLSKNLTVKKPRKPRKKTPTAFSLKKEIKKPIREKPIREKPLSFEHKKPIDELEFITDAELERLFLLLIESDWLNVNFIARSLLASPVSVDYRFKIFAQKHGLLDEYKKKKNWKTAYEARQLVSMTPELETLLDKRLKQRVRAPKQKTKAETETNAEAERI